MLLRSPDNPPQIAEPGLVFSGVVGPWIERGAEGLCRISPLLSGVGREIQEGSWAKAMHGRVARVLLRQRKLSADDVSHILLHATAGKDWSTVAVLSFSLLTADEEIWEALSRSAGWFVVVGIGDPPERPCGDPFALFLIRTLQLRLAMGVLQLDALPAIIDCANQELPATAVDGPARLIRHHFLVQVLGVRVQLPIQQILRTAFEFLRLSDELADALAGFKNIDKIMTGPDGKPDLASLAQDETASQSRVDWWITPRPFARNGRALKSLTTRGTRGRRPYRAARGQTFVRRSRSLHDRFLGQSQRTRR
jgi:hypothetical protein